jgi:flagellar hook-length control protein FliK
MQAVSISNVSPAKAPVPGAASLLSPAPQQSSPFAALFQAKLKSGNDAAKLPAAGKAKDSARAQDATTITLDSPAVIPQVLGFVVGSPNPAVQALIVPANATPADCAPSHDSIAAMASTPSPASAIPSVDAGPDNTQPPDSLASPADTRSLSPARSVRMNVTPVVVFPQPLANIAAPDSNPVAQIADTAPNRHAPSNLPSIGAPQGQGGAKPQGTVVAPQDSQNLSSPLSVRTSMPQGPLSSTDTPQGQGAANATSTDRKAAAPSTPSLPAFQVLQAANTRFEFLNLPTSEVTPVPENPSEQIPQPFAPGNASQLTPQLHTAMAAAASATPVPTATQSMAIGASTPASREALHPQAANSASLVPDGTATARPQSKDTSNGSPGNDANAKSEHISNSAAGRTDGNGFGQTLEIAGANAGTVQAASTDLAAVAAATRASAEPRAASVEAKSSAGNAAPLPPGQHMPAAAGANQPIVSAARLVDHAGQTEMRIEMQVDSLGGVELRARISGNQIGASIVVEHHDAQIFLANDLPALHNALVEKHLRVDSLSVSQGMPSSTTGGPGSDAGQRGFSQAPPKPVYAAQDGVAMPVPNAPSENLGASNAHVRLSVLA